MNRTNYFFFLDETGDHGLSTVDLNFPYFLLCGCLFSYDEKRKMEEEMNKIKKRFFGNTNVIFHSRDIRKCEKEFQVLFDNSIKNFFYAAINKMMSKLNFTIIAAAINKEKHIKRYGRVADNPYAISLSFVLERVIFCLESLAPQEQVNIIVESRGKKEDKELLDCFNRIYDLGTHFVNRNRMRTKISHFQFRKKTENDNGVQLADLCA